MLLSRWLWEVSPPPPAACSVLQDGLAMKPPGALCNDWNWQAKTTGTGNRGRKLNQEGTEDSKGEMPCGCPGSQPLRGGTPGRWIPHQVATSPNLEMKTMRNRNAFDFRSTLPSGSTRKLELLKSAGTDEFCTPVNSSSKFYFCRAPYADGTASVHGMISVSRATTDQKTQTKTQKPRKTTRLV